MNFSLYNSMYFSHISRSAGHEEMGSYTFGTAFMSTTVTSSPDSSFVLKRMKSVKCCGSSFKSTDYLEICN